MEIVGNIHAAFVVILCTGGFKTHFCPKALMGGLLADIATRGDSEREVRGTNKGAIDLPGMCMANRPWEKMMIGDFEFSVPTQDFDIILGKLERAPLRKFADGQEYHKVHGAYHCLVVTPEQRDALLDVMLGMMSDVRKRSDDADEEMGERIKKLNEHPNIDVGKRIRIPEPPKDNN